MKIAVLADIHSNFVALQTVAEHIDRWQPDSVYVLGDVVNRGPRPLECWQFVQQRACQQGWQVLKGNHEEYVVDRLKPQETFAQAQRQIFRSSLWTCETLGRELVLALDALPFSIEAPELRTRFTHASMLGTRVGIFPFTPTSDLPALIGPANATLRLFCVGHTHRPCILQSGNTQVVNVGSAGLPFDGDTRVSYVQLTGRADNASDDAGDNWHAELVRLDYDRAAAVRDFTHSGFLDAGGPLAQIMVYELWHAQGYLFTWSQQYESDVIAGKISIEESVQRFIGGLVAA